MVQSPVAGVRRMSYEEFLQDSSAEGCEWVDGEAIPLMAVSLEHKRVAHFILTLLTRFNETSGMEGEVLYEPFNIKLGANLPGRSPDVAFVLPAHTDRLRERFLDGPADVVVDVISPGSAAIDRGEKYFEYEQAGIPEYWLIDPQRRVAEFYRLGESGVYELAATPDGVFRSAVLPGFFLRIAWLWDRPRLTDAERELGLR